MGPRSTWLRGFTAAAVAGVGNLAIYLGARGLGVSFRIRGQADVFITAQALTIGWRWFRLWNAVGWSVGSILVATVAFRLTRRWRWVGAALLVLGTLATIVALTAPWNVRIEDATRVALCAMILVVWLASVVAFGPVVVSGGREPSLDR